MVIRLSIIEQYDPDSVEANSCIFNTLGRDIQKVLKVGKKKTWSSINIISVKMLG